MKRNFWAGMLRSENGRPAGKLWLYFLLAHLAMGILAFPMLLLSDASEILVICADTLIRLLYPLLSVICLSLAALNIRQGRWRSACGVWGVLCVGEFLSSLLTQMLYCFDEYFYIYTLDVVILTALLEAVLDVLYTAAVTLLLLVLLWLCRKTAKGQTATFAPAAIGICCFLYLVGSELPTTITFLQDYWGMVQPNEVLYMIVLYLVFAAAGVGAYFLARWVADKAALPLPQGDKKQTSK